MCLQAVFRCDNVERCPGDAIDVEASEREEHNSKAGKNDLDDMFAAATKLAHAHKKLCLRRALTQVRHPVADSRLTASRVVKSGPCSSRASDERLCRVS